MALRSASGLDPIKQKISIRIQEFDPEGNGRPYEEDLIEDGLCADSIGDVPLVGDYLGLDIVEIVKGKEVKRPQMFRVKSRYFSLPAMIERNWAIICNVVVERVTNKKELARVIKD